MTLLKKFGALIVTAFSVLAIASCEKAGTEDTVSLSASVSVYKGKALVNYKADSQFIIVEAPGAWTLSVSCSDGGNWASISPESGSGEKRNVILSYDENTGEDARIATVILKVAGDSEEYSCSVTQTGKQKSGGQLTTNYGQDVTKCGWLELPATVAADGRDFFYLNMKAGSTTMRNFSYDWDYTNFVSHWVAYPLNKSLRGSGGRSNAWGLDPNLPESQQSNITMRGFNPSSTYARGHQCPSADRLINVAANEQTFYGTNMTPQMHVFNEGIWVNLEGKVRSWCDACDTLYVVTGCVVNPESTKGTQGKVGGYALDNVGNKVAIPTAYYKAVLRYQKSSSYGYGGYAACAIYLDHKDYGDAAITKSYAISIDELEKKTGIDFYVNLANVIGADNAAKVEAQDPKEVGVWW